MTKLSTTKPGETPFISSGTGSKPSGCNLCQFRTKGAGFVADFVPENPPKLALVLDYPAPDDVLNRRPWSGKAGYAWEKLFLEPVGLTRSDVLLSHVIRCRPLNFKYPIGPVKRSAELTCRRYDDEHCSGAETKPGGLIAYDPNLFLITFKPYDARQVPALGRLIISDLRRALKKREEGYRPAVLMGTDVMELVAPWLASKGGSQGWRGHWWEGEWPWKTKEEPRPMFSEVVEKWGRR